MVSDESGLDKLKAFFENKGLRVCGGLAYSVSESNGYQGFDYADPNDREFVKHAAETAAKHFDEILLDDYFFFDRKTDLDIQAKGNRSWTQFRLDTMRDVAENLIVKPAKAVNPRCQVIIKMANWYDQYASMGNDTEKASLPTGCSAAQSRAPGQAGNNICSLIKAMTSCGSWTTSNRV